jgi:transketolase
VLYDPDDEFEIGGSRVLRSSDEDEVAIVAAGITVHEALTAADTLAEEGIVARVIDLYSIKPLDAETLFAAAEATHGRLVTVEDHWPQGGLGEAVLAAFADADERPRVTMLAVREMPSSGTPNELLATAGIDAEHIAAAARKLTGVPSAGARR